MICVQYTLTQFKVLYKFKLATVKLLMMLNMLLNLNDPHQKPDSFLHLSHGLSCEND